MRYSVHFIECDHCGLTTEGQTKGERDGNARREGFVRTREGRKVIDLCDSCAKPDGWRARTRKPTDGRPTLSDAARLVAEGRVNEGLDAARRATKDDSPTASSDGRTGGTDG